MPTAIKCRPHRTSLKEAPIHILAKALLTGCLPLSTYPLAAGQVLEAGDIWSYKTRPGETGSTLTILKIEHYPDLGEVVHIRVDGIHLVNPLKGNQISDIPHLPFKVGALENSLLQRVATTRELPDFSEGHGVWKAAHQQHRAGAFDTPLSQTLDAVVGGSWEEREEGFAAG